MSRDPRTRIAELEEIVRLQREAFAPAIAFPEAWRLSSRDAAILAALYTARGAIVSADALVLWVEGVETLSIGVAASRWISILRDKVERYGVAIASIQGRGYALTTESRLALAAAIGEQIPPSACLRKRVPARNARAA